MASFPQYGDIYPEVQKTIKSRGNNQITVTDLKPWIRLTSGVGNGLILTSNQRNDTFSTRYGDDNRAGRLGTDFAGRSVFELSGKGFNRGHRPSPVIEAISIANGSEGLSRKLTTQIKCFSLPQLDTITGYFLEPRFYVLAEWGWNTNDAYSHMAKLQGKGVSNESAICEMINYVNLSTLKSKRKGSNGNYDAFLGVITGGSIEYGEDETYIVNVEVTTQGEIPAYLQQHKGTVKNIKKGAKNTNESSLIFDVEEIEAAETANLVGEALFMQMYNDLPGGKQIQKIKDLKSDPYWASEWQFINMSKTVKDKLLETLKDTEVNVKGVNKDGKIPSDQPIIGEERFIRMELAWKLLNSIDASLQPQPISCKSLSGSELHSLDMTINIDNTICRAHKHIFSTDKTKLYIPNKTSPDFGLSSVLTNNADLKGQFLQMDENGDLKTCNLAPTGLADDKVFPQMVDLDIQGGASYDDSLHGIKCDAYEWGYLKDLYINFEFFCQTMERSGYVAKDMAIELLNGLASSVNLFWNFQLVNDGSTSAKDKGNEILKVVDTSFNGVPPTSAKNLAVFQSIGVNSPFLEFNVKIEVAGALANQIMAQQVSNESSLNVEDKPEDLAGGLFASKPDPVAQQLHQIYKTTNKEEAEREAKERELDSETKKKKEWEAWQKVKKDTSIGTQFGAVIYAAFDGDENTSALSEAGDLISNTTGAVIDATKSAFGADTAEQGKNRATNFELFMKKAGVYGKLNDPNNMGDLADEWWDLWGANDTTIDDNTLVVATWNDTQLLRQIYEYDLNPSVKVGARDIKIKKNPGFLPIEVTFKVHGVSGIKIGDTLRIVDLPHVYKRKLLQVFNVEQSVDDDMWTTNVVAKVRNVDISTTT